MGLYEYCRGRAIERVDPSGLKTKLGWFRDLLDWPSPVDLSPGPLFPSFVPFVPSGFSERISWCDGNDAVVIALLAALAAAGCPRPSVKERADCSPGRYGEYSDGSITICQPTGVPKSPYYTCRTYAHELQHALDACARTSQSRECSDLACRELRAVNLSGQCCRGSPFFENGNFTTYESCILSFATASSKSSPSRLNAGCGGDDVRAAMSNKNCYDRSKAPCSSWPLNPTI